MMTDELQALEDRILAMTNLIKGLREENQRLRARVLSAESRIEEASAKLEALIERQEATHG
ncbi:MAG: hypothetical protein ACO3QP_05310 [Burkholderiaceae bacterium]|jgi:predicted  nucleic acid-binding Zn-ribbon protein